MNYHLKLSFFKFLFEFPDHLIDQLHKIQFCHFQCDISGTCLGCLYDIFCKNLQSLCLIFQNFQIPPDLGIFRIFPFEKIYIVDDRSQRCLYIMRNIRNQFCLHPLVLEAVFYGCVQSLPDMVNIIRHHFLLTGEFFRWNFILQLTVCDFFQSTNNLFSSPCLFQQPVKYCHIQYKQKQQGKHGTSSKSQHNKQHLCKYKTSKPGSHLYSADGIFTHKNYQISDSFENFFNHPQHMSEK